MSHNGAVSNDNLPMFVPDADVAGAAVDAAGRTGAGFWPQAATPSAKTATPQPSTMPRMPRCFKNLRIFRSVKKEQGATLRCQAMLGDLKQDLEPVYALFNKSTQNARRTNCKQVWPTRQVWPSRAGSPHTPQPLAATYACGVQHVAAAALAASRQLAVAEPAQSAVRFAHSFARPPCLRGRLQKTLSAHPPP